MSDLKKVYVTSGPHIKTAEGTTAIMADVIIALIPALIMSVLTFGFRALVITFVCVISAILSELAFNLISKQTITIKDLSCVITGILFAYNLPVAIPLWIASFGSVFAIIVIKMIFGGLGQNIVNPALAARIFIVLCFTTEMTTFTLPGQSLPLYGNVVDAISSATPLADLKAGMLPSETINDLFIGQVAGTIGETSVFAIIIGALYLFVRRVINPIIPLSFLGTVFILTYLFPGSNDPLLFATYHVFGGGLMLAAFFMATDYVTSPITKKGKLVFGIGCGLITVFLRFFGGSAEGASYAILIMNILVYLIDKYTLPRKFGSPSFIRIKKEENHG